MECLFGVLQARFAIVASLARLWSPNILTLIMEACVILHNMIIEDETMEQLHNIDPIIPFGQVECGGSTAVPYGEYLDRMSSYQDSTKHYELQRALIEHLWRFHGDSV